MLADELEKLWRLNQTGVLNDHEFRAAKERLLASESSGAGVGGSDGSVQGRIYGIQRQTWIMLMHLSQLLAFAGGIGFAAPIIMWAVSKDDSADANRHGLMIINWLLSSLLYGLVGGILSMALIGIPILVALFVVIIVFPIIGGMKASSGEFWRYPLTISFFEPPAEVRPTAAHPYFN